MLHSNGSAAFRGNSADPIFFLNRAFFTPGFRSLRQIPSTPIRRCKTSYLAVARRADYNSKSQLDVTTIDGAAANGS